MGGGGLRYLIIQGQAEGMEGSGEGNCINVTTEHFFLKSPLTHTHTHSTSLSLSSWMSLTHFVPSLMQVPVGDDVAMPLSPAMEARTERCKDPSLPPAHHKLFLHLSHAPSVSPLFLPAAPAPSTISPHVRSLLQPSFHPPGAHLRMAGF